jgi:c(7)-type cytochrome triheme protein
MAKAGASAADAAICTSPRMPYPEHGACIGCHPTAFFQQPLVICGNCHSETTITRRSPLKPQSGDAAPLRTEFDHYLHLDPGQRVRKQFGFEKDCTFCHAFADGGRRVTLPQHAQCCECHTKADVEPNIVDCAKCHTRPASQANPASKVRKFSHADHKLDPATGATLPCLRCHFEVPAARDIPHLQLPKMATCVECHQGEIAFSYADCLKCHDKGIEAQLVPASHREATRGK